MYRFRCEMHAFSWLISICGRKTEFFVNQTAKNAKNAETADKRNVDLLLRRATSCDQTNLRISNLKEPKLMSKPCSSWADFK